MAEQSFQYKGFNVYRLGDRPHVVIEGVAYPFTGSLGNIRVGDLKEFTGNTSSGQSGIDKVNNYLAEQARQQQLQVETQKVNTRNRMVEQLGELARLPTSYLYPLLDKFMAEGKTSLTESDIQNIRATAPLSQSTDFQKYFDEQKASGRSAEDILRNNPFVPVNSLPENSLPSSVEQELDVLTDHLVNTPINPDVEINPEMVNQFLTQAKQELAPYYGQLFSQAQNDLQTGFREITEDLTTRERQLEQEYGTQLSGIQEAAAQRGLTFSTSRLGQEKTLAEQTQAAIDAGRQEAQRRALQLGTEGERLIGTSNIPSLPQLEGAPSPVVGRAGVFTFNRPSEKRDLFASVGGTTGTLEQQRSEAEQARKLELQGAERELRGTYTR